MLNFGPQSYWRLNETSGTTAASSVLTNEGTDNGTYNGVVLNEQPGPLAGTTSSIGAAGFDYSYVQLPDSLADEAGSMSVSLWFNSTATDGVLFSQSADTIPTWNTTNPLQPGAVHRLVRQAPRGLRRHRHPAGVVLARSTTGTGTTSS